MKINSIIIYSLTFILLSFVNNRSQSLNVNFGADFVSHYIWRGIEVNNSPNIQPSVEFQLAGFKLGYWGSYRLSNHIYGTDEMDIFLSYSLNTNVGEFSLIFTDYYFPDSGIRIGNFSNGDGAHTLEIGVNYEGEEKFPVSVSMYYNFYNDRGNNTYFQLGYPVSVSKIDLNFFVGATTGSVKNPGYYGASDFSIINFGFNAGYEIELTEEFYLPLSSSFVLNPNAETAYIIFAAGLRL